MEHDKSTELRLILFLISFPGYASVQSFRVQDPLTLERSLGSLSLDRAFYSLSNARLQPPLDHINGAILWALTVGTGEPYESTKTAFSRGAPKGWLTLASALDQFELSQIQSCKKAIRTAIDDDVLTSRDMGSGLEAFSHNPTDDSFGPLAAQAGPNTNYPNERSLSY
ncbi:hypothetical protein K457DRAFT_1882124 [Linnemannia elongata AG-77]|uniref:Uncharacterized protein n=1 Tax=Linnemannia elongata AG-77 TaxID=1314771 RepID=A0A197JCB0_9FUNG|nr:hypothetical protein K457DRAFT_1882124 [Linnemannia elongata AG-77]